MTVTNFPFPLLNETEQPFIVKFFDWYRENRRSILDILVLLILSCTTFYLIIVFDLAEAFYEFSRKHETWELDEIVVALAVPMPLYISIFAIRRWREATHRLKLANTDSLTDLFNRRKGWRSLLMEVERAKRYNRPLSVIMFDLDHFKSVNDRFGHAGGDLILSEIAKLVQKGLRNTDILARWGGEEFIIISTETTLPNAAIAAERLRTTIEKHTFSKSIKITASFGLADLEIEESADSLLLRADKMLYMAKTNGRNKVYS